MDQNCRITFLSGVGTVTGANFLVETDTNEKILVDCGLIQEEFAVEENGKPFAFDASSVKALCVTHAHLDHVGRIPKLVKDGFRGTIYSTSQTRALAEIVLLDAVKIMRSEAERDGKEPIYGDGDVQAIFPYWKAIPYHEETAIADGVSIYLKDAGHILGSSMVEMKLTGDKSGSAGRPDTKDVEDGHVIKILFTGDLGNSPAPLLRDTEEAGDVDYIVMESTYGDRNHESKDERDQRFEKIIKETIARGGTLVIPSFAIDRTQTLLYELNNMVEQGRIRSVPVFVDSPMAIKATEIYSQSTDLFNDNVQEQIGKGDKIFGFPNLEFTMSANESRDIEKMKGAKIILAGSGMSVGGRVISHEEFYLPDARNTILLVGYQTAGSIGRQLAEGAGKLSIHGRKIAVKAHIEELYGYSAHKDSDHLLGFVSTAGKDLKKVFVVMGEPKASIFLAQRINNELSASAMVPEKEKPYSLD